MIREDARSFPINERSPSIKLRYSFCLIAFYWAIFPLAQAADDSPTEKLPIPRQPAQAKADHDLHERFKADFANHDVAGDLALAQKLRDESSGTDDAALRFVMLKESRELYIDAGDLTSALAAIDEMAAHYAIDVRDMKLSAMSVAVDKSLAEPPALTTLYLDLGDRFLNEGDVDLAEHACRLAQNVIHNRRLHDADLDTRLKEQHRTVTIALKETREVLGAMRKLKASPDDPKANLIVGRYACFLRGLWNQNLPMLAKGSDSGLKMLANDELKVPTSPAAIAFVADGWWAIAETATTPIARRKIREHAAEWYKKAIPKLEGEQKQSAEQRVVESSH